MIFEVHVPAAPLNSFVEYLWFYDEFQPLHTKERVLPDGAMELVIDLGEHPKRKFDPGDFSRSVSYRRSWISGVHREPIVIEAAPGSMMGAHFRSGGAWPFFSPPVSEFAGQVIESNTVLGREIERLRERLLESPTIPGRFELLEQFLLRQGEGRLQTDPLIDRALQLMVSAPVRLLMSDLAGALGVSHQRLISRFERRVGLRPKQFDRVMRFRQVFRVLAREDPHSVDWPRVALDCGYYDQSHFIHEFHALAGLTPTGYADRNWGASQYLVVDPTFLSP